jgi:hypothetical protein
MRLFVDDHNDQFPIFPVIVGAKIGWHQYKAAIAPYITSQDSDMEDVPLQWNHPSSGLPPENVFKCPSDQFFFDGIKFQKSGFKDQFWTDHASYAFNGDNIRGTNNVTGAEIPGIAGKQLAHLRSPAKTLLIVEAAAMSPYSWHNPHSYKDDFRQNGSRNALGFVDGHVDYLKMFWQGKPSNASDYNPPPGYSYQWNGQ